MFKRKKDYCNKFVFNYACRSFENNVAFSIIGNKASANWYDENGVNHHYDDVEVTLSAWQELEELTQKLGVFEWKAHILYTHFAFSLDTSTFNAEGVFPSGKSFAANNFHGEPNGFEAAVDAYKMFFAELNL